MNPIHTQVEPLVEADWIAEQLDNPTIRIIEVDVSPAAYEQGHIPGAVLWNAYTDLRHPNYAPISTPELERLLSSSGVTPETTILFYGYGAHLGFWLMKAHGHDQVRFMDGPRDNWQLTGNPLSLETPMPTPSTYTLTAGDLGFRPSRQAVEAMIGKTDTVILDVRSQAEYDGDCFWPSGATEGAGRAGHIPTSVHLSIDKLRTEDGYFRNPDELQTVLHDHGVTPDRQVVSYCTIGNRASQAWFAINHLLDYPDTGVYYGSWAEWGTHPDTPIEP
jgi:thiosulfate/3-mercaptopyruvate sulfurtransferase